MFTLRHYEATDWRFEQEKNSIIRLIQTSVSFKTHPKCTPFVAATISKSLSSGNISNLRVKYSLPKEY